MRGNRLLSSRWLGKGVLSRVRRNDGFTLVETMVAIFVLTIGMLGIFQVLAGNLVMNADARNRALAMHAAERQIEATRSLTPEQINNVSPTYDTTVSSLGTGATWERSVNAVGASGNLIGVTITVRWKQNTRPQTLTLSTLVHRSGINAIRTL